MDHRFERDGETETAAATGESSDEQTQEQEDATSSMQDSGISQTETDALGPPNYINNNGSDLGGAGAASASDI